MLLFNFLTQASSLIVTVLIYCDTSLTLSDDVKEMWKQFPFLNTSVKPDIRLFQLMAMKEAVLPFLIEADPYRSSFTNLLCEASKR